MRNKLIASLLVVAIIIASGLVWSVRRSRNTAIRPSIAFVYPAQPVNHILVAASTKQVGKETAFHFYSPLRDPPPIATPEQYTQWDYALRATIVNEIKPDLAGPSLASTYAKELAKAKQGDLQAATTLFNGIMYCNQQPAGPIYNQQELANKIADMRKTQTAYDGVHTDNPAVAVANVQQLYRYCAGITPAMNSAENLGYLASRAVKGGNPATLAWASDRVSTGLDGVTFSKPKNMSPTDWNASVQKSKVEERTLLDRAAAAGVAHAWLLKSYFYRSGTGAYPMDPVKAYASLYTGYMLTKSPALAYSIWKQSQQLDPLQIAEGETIARQNYQRIQSQEKLNK